MNNIISVGATPERIDKCWSRLSQLAAPGCGAELPSAGGVGAGRRRWDVRVAR